MVNDGVKNSGTDITSFLMVGQSNMAGRGDFGEVESINNADCYMLRMGKWQRMSEPINPDRAIFDNKFHSGTNLCASFADRYAKHFNKKIGLIPCADGGTTISQWQPGEIMFDHAVMMAKLAMRSSNFGGILWHQGESDCTEANISLYKGRAIHMIAELRKALNAENLPFIFGEVSEDITPVWNFGEYPKQMNSIFREMQREIPNCRLVSAKGLTLKPDGIHFNSVSLREFGSRYFDAYLELFDTNSD